MRVSYADRLAAARMLYAQRQTDGSTMRGASDWHAAQMTVYYHDDDTLYRRCGCGLVRSGRGFSNHLRSVEHIARLFHVRLADVGRGIVTPAAISRAKRRLAQCHAGVLEEDR